MWIKDNQYYQTKDFSDVNNLYGKLVNKTLKELAKNDNLLVFPQEFSDSEDLEEKDMVLEQINHQVKTGNIVGFIGCNDEKIAIRSRFSRGEDDYFLHYLLQKVLHVNLVDFPIQFSFDEQIYQLLAHLFPYYLQNAMRKGLYKEYKAFHYNDSNVRGNIDIARHLRDNTPFTGRIAYHTREMTFDNPIMNLVRHTIEVLKQSTTSNIHILEKTPVIKQFVSDVLAATPRYNPFERTKLIRYNRINPVKHAYYHEYRQLQQLCLMILDRREHDLRQSSDKVHGILFDVAWLWEEYLALLLTEDYIHPNNRKKTGGVSFFSSHTHTVYPDFYKKDKKLILDAK